MGNQGKHPRKLATTLSPRMKEARALIADGYSRKMTAELMGITVVRVRQLLVAAAERDSRAGELSKGGR